MRNSLKNIIFSLLPGLVFFLVCEGVLRLFHFQYSDMPLEMRTLVHVKSRLDAGNKMVESVLLFNNREGNAVQFKKDPYQLWVPVHSFEEAIKVEKPANAIRFASLGCSCTAGCVWMDEKQSYNSMASELLAEKSGRRVEALNAGVGSYSSFQGLQRLKRVVLKYKPDILTIFFGWNDHWFSVTPDSEIKVRSPLTLSFINFFEQSRVYQFIHFLISKIEYKRSDKKMFVARVPIDQYEKNLNSMIDLANANKIRVLLITAPADLSNFTETSWFPFPKEKLIPIHQAYNQVVRKVALDRHVALLDLETIVANESPESVFYKDGIHFHEAGCRFVARKIVEALFNQHVIDQFLTKPIS